MTSAAPVLPDSTLPFAVRIGTAEDRAYVLSTWLKTDERRGRSIEGAFYRPWQARMMADVLARPSTCVRVAHPEGDAATIMGWLAYEDGHPAILHYCYVRESARRLGIARMLLGELASREIAIVTARPHPSLPIELPSGWSFMQRAGVYGAPDTKHLNRTGDPK